MKPAILIIAFNRAKSIKRLLKSIANAQYEQQDISLCICIDYQDTPANREVVRIANEFEWKNGKKRVIHQEENLGLKSHILKCGNLVNEYGSIIMLEDDCFVSTHFYRYAYQALSFYQHEASISGISLYSRKKNFINYNPFITLDDNSDVFFLQLSSSSGQAWTKKQWNDFINWKNQFSVIPKDALIPDFVISWPETSWVKYYVLYLQLNKKYFVYPKKSFTTNFGDIGTNSGNQTTTFEQVPLAVAKTVYNFIPIKESKVLYDTFLELSPSTIKHYCPWLKDFDFEVDLNGLKPLSKISKPYVLTSKISKKYIYTFGLQMKPMELNIIHQVEGDFFRLAKKGDLEPNNEFDFKYQKTTFNWLFGLISPKTKLNNIINIIYQKMFNR